MWCGGMESHELRMQVVSANHKSNSYKGGLLGAEVVGKSVHANIFFSFHSISEPQKIRETKDRPGKHRCKRQNHFCRGPLETKLLLLFL